MVGITDITSIKALTIAWQKFSRGKKSRKDVTAYQRNLQANLMKLHHVLQNGSYTHHPYERFTIFDPKQRQIHKATVTDRIVHQAIVSAIEPLFEKRFIYDSYSCRVDKGTHAGVLRLQSFLRKASRNNTQKVYVLKCDIRKYFASIDHEILLDLIAQRVQDETILELVRAILLSQGRETGRGIPLGNITSQLFANVYLHEFDWFMKHTLQVKYYIRYCDDFVIVSTDKEYLENLIEPIQVFLQSALGLDLHPHKVTIRPWYQGIDFLGTIIKPQAMILRTKTNKRLLTRVDDNNLSSYLGMCGHVNGYRLSNTLKNIAWVRDNQKY